MDLTKLRAEKLHILLSLLLRGHLLGFCWKRLAGISDRLLKNRTQGIGFFNKDYALTHIRVRIYPLFIKFFSR